MNLIFENTCEACPEQYDVFDIDVSTTDRRVAYIRLRWGRLTCAVPNPMGILVYDHSFVKDGGYKGISDKDEGYKGIFDSEEERVYHLNEIKMAILKHYQNEHSV